MNSLTNLTSEQLSKAARVKRQIASLETKLERILGGRPQARLGRPRKKRKFRMSAAGRARIVAAQKARWAKVKGKSAKPKRRMSAAGRARIAAAARARWAKAKAAGKNRL